MKLATTKVIIPLLLTLVAASGVEAHEGEDHGTPEPVVAVPGEALLSATGAGAAFDAVLKYRPFARGEQVALALYLVSSETNRPVGDATVNANLSDGDKSTTIAFQPKAGGPVGLYSATVTPESDVAMSWLFDVSAGSESDLIAISGFKAGAKPLGKEVGDVAAPHTHDGPPQIAIFISLSALLAIGAFAAGRISARKGVPA